MTPNTPTVSTSTPDPEPYLLGRKRFLTVLVIAWAICLLICGYVETIRLRDAANSPSGISSWLIDWNVDTTPYFMLCLVAFVLWKFQHRFSSKPSPSQITQLTDKPSRLSKYAGAVTVGLLALGTSVWVAWQPVSQNPLRYFGDLPPAYHDEYSYLFQAETFLAGRTWFPSQQDFPRAFNQVHVLNEGKFASRYFPGVGLWIAPFLALGHPHLGHWIAGAIIAACVYLTGWEIGGRRLAWWGGLLTALSPGLALFSNLLLSHHPTLVGLTFFQWQFLRMVRRQSLVSALAAGCGLSFAMLCRPMTAAGFGLPFGLWFVWWLFRASKSRQYLTDLQDHISTENNQTCRPTDFSARTRSSILFAMGLPLVVGFLVQIGLNLSITGQWNLTPYQQYTDIYTPRHVYGFNNVKRGEQNLGPKVLENYDRWAENLDASLAMRNVGHRLLASGQWTWGFIPLVAAAIVTLGIRRRNAAGNYQPYPLGISLAITAIISMHVVHIPYWYDGIMHWHYVFETAPLWLLILAHATVEVERGSRILAIRWIGSIWHTLIISALAINFMALSPFWPISKIAIGVSNIGFSRLKYAEVRESIDRMARHQPALVFVIPDPRDRHIDYVTNSPRLDSPIVFARWDKDVPQNLNRWVEMFPGRQFFIYDASDQRLYDLNSLPHSR